MFNRFPRQRGLTSIMGTLLSFGGLAVFAYLSLTYSPTTVYDSGATAGTLGETPAAAPADSSAEGQPATSSSRFTAQYLDTPERVKAIYMSTCAAATPSFRERFRTLLAETEANAIVIDVKDYTGQLGFPAEGPELTRAAIHPCLVPDLEQFIEELNRMGVYTIARITVFQDPLYAERHPSVAVQQASDGGLWRDYKGLAYVDPGAKEHWDYTLAISEAAYQLGFDELNFDYIRFPSDGNMQNISLPVSGSRDKPVVLEEFFRYLDQELKDEERFAGVRPPVISADLFGMTTTNYDDLQIGQVLERALPYFDYIAPMVYPSHYPETFLGFKNPAAHPYQVIHHAMAAAVRRTTATTTPINHLSAERIGTSTPAVYTKESYSPDKLRPWLQDFDLGATYTADMVRAQIQATYDTGINSWMLWDPANQYTAEALKAQ